MKSCSGQVKKEEIRVHFAAKVFTLFFHVLSCREEIMLECSAAVREELSETLQEVVKWRSKLMEPLQET